MNAPTRPLARRRPTDDGVITAMMVILMMCLLLTIIAVTDLSAAYLRRENAISLADGASLAGTSAAAAGAVYSDPSARYVPIDERAAIAAVHTYLRQTGAYDDYPGLTVQVRVVGHQIVVALAMRYRLPIPLPGAETTTLIHATASAELPIYQ